MHDKVDLSEIHLDIGLYRRQYIDRVRMLL